LTLEKRRYDVPHILVWDIETVPIFAGSALPMILMVRATKSAAAIGDKFPKHKAGGVTWLRGMTWYCRSP
jgi:hypothetical protein